MALGEKWEIRRGVSVTRRIRNLKPNLKVYIDPTKMDEFPYDDGLELGRENIDPFIVGTVVDNLSRLNICNDVMEAFHISILGGMNSGRGEELMGYLSGIDGADDESITNACRAYLFDAYYRSGKPPEYVPSELAPDHRTCENIRIMLDRTMRFFDNSDPK